MKRGIEILKFLVLLGLLTFLFSFSKKRNDTRNLNKLEVEFIGDNVPFIAHETVNKLLIQNEVAVTDIGKEAVVLNDMEKRLRENPMVRNAEVYLTLDGVLGAKIEQRDPIGRVSPQHLGGDYYLDADGKKMPLSKVYSARVPIITGISENDYDEITTLLLQIRQDDFMRQNVIGLIKKDNGEIEMELRKSDIKVLFGKPEDIKKKFQNFKAFYKKTKEDSTLFGYEKVNLKFVSQVIATKKIGHGKR